MQPWRPYAREPGDIAPWQTLFGYALAPASFTALFGGDLLDSLCAFLCGSLVGFCLQRGVKWWGRNVFLRTVVCSGIAGLLALLLSNLGIGNHVDLITIGTLMLLVPGVAITNSMWELVAGDTYSGPKPGWPKRFSSLLPSH